jgi:shikimate kinase
MSRNLCLSGMMGAGKSTVAVRLGERLGRRVADTDEELRRWTGRSIPELFEQHGEAGFRELERRVIEELATYHDLVIALCGGVVLRDDNVASLLLTGVIVHLDVPADVLVARLTGDSDRPLLAGGELTDRVSSTLAARHDRYLDVADLRIDAARAVDEVADGILSWAMSTGDVLTPSEYEQVMT